MVQQRFPGLDLIQALVVGHYILGCSLVERIGSESISSARSADCRAVRTAQRSSTGSEWINRHTFNWKGSFKRMGLIALVVGYVL